MSNNPQNDFKILNAIAQSRITQLNGALLFDDFYPNEKLSCWTDSSKTQLKTIKPIDYALQMKQDKSALFLLENGAQITFQHAIRLLMLAKETDNFQLAETVAQRLPKVLIPYRNNIIIRRLTSNVHEQSRSA